MIIRVIGVHGTVISSLTHDMKSRLVRIDCTLVVESSARATTRMLRDSVLGPASLRRYRKEISGHLHLSADFMSSVSNDVQEWLTWSFSNIFFRAAR